MSDLGNKEVMANNLQRYMKKHNKSRNDISRDLDVPYTTVTAWINADTYPRIDKIEMLANYFNIEKSDLVEDKNRKSNETREFATAQDAMRFLLEQPTLAAFGGYDASKMTDEQLIRFANRILKFIKMEAEDLEEFNVDNMD